MKISIKLIYFPYKKRKIGRVVDGARLEHVFPFMRDQGSNPWSSELGFFLSQSDARYQYIGEISGVRHPWFSEKSLKLDWLYGYIVYNIRAFNVIWIKIQENERRKKW